MRPRPVLRWHTLLKRWQHPNVGAEFKCDRCSMLMTNTFLVCSAFRTLMQQWEGDLTVLHRGGSLLAENSTPPALYAAARQVSLPVTRYP